VCDGNGNENDLNGNGRDWESKRHSRTPLVLSSDVALLGRKIGQDLTKLQIV